MKFIEKIFPEKFINKVLFFCCYVSEIISGSEWKKFINNDLWIRKEKSFEFSVKYFDSFLFIFGNRSGVSKLPQIMHQQIKKRYAISQRNSNSHFLGKLNKKVMFLLVKHQNNLKIFKLFFISFILRCFWKETFQLKNFSFRFDKHFFLSRYEFVEGTRRKSFV